MASESDCYSDNDRSRSIIELTDEEPMSPISSKLKNKTDMVSKQKLRERLLKRNIMKQKAHYYDSESPQTSNPAVNISESSGEGSEVFERMEESIRIQSESSDEESLEEGRRIQSSTPFDDTLENSLKIDESSSIICINSDEEETKEISSPDSSKENIELVKTYKTPEKLPPHLSKYATDSLEMLNVKKEKMEDMLIKSASFNLKDGGDSIRKTIDNIKEAIKIKSNFKIKEKELVKSPELKSPKSIVDYQQRPPIISPPKFNPENYSRLLAHDKKRIFGGKMSDNRWERIQNVTEGALKEMHNLIMSMPDEHQLTKTPVGINVELLPHQQHGLTWMLWREKQSVPGGILADDMGLGKTLTTISLILQQKNDRLKRKEEGKYDEDRKKREAAKDMGLVPSNCTLVVAPASVMHQWEAEINRRVEDEKLSVHIFHGPKNKRISDPKRLARYDVVITTYTLVGIELTEKITTKNSADDQSDKDTDDGNDNRGDYEKITTTKKPKNRRVMNTDSVLAKIAFERVILDEAHQIKNKTTASSKGVCHIPSRCHWCLSGTPVQNKLWDLYSLIRFIRLSPFDDEKHWKEYIMGSSQKCADRLNLITKSLLLRRTKAQKCAITQKPLVDLKPKQVKQHDLLLEGIEGDIYDIMFRASQIKVKQLLSEAESERHENLYEYRRKTKKQEVEDMKNPFTFGNRVINANDKFNSMSSMLVLLLRLRQACVHMHLTKEAVDMEAFEHLGGDEGSADDFLERTMAELTLNEEKLQEASIKNAEEVFERSYMSSKLKKLMEIVTDVVDKNEKIVIVSQWTSLLEIVEGQIKKRRINYTSITGSVVISDRQSRVNSFNTENSGPQVMLLSLKAGGDGLNLIGGNHLVMVDLHWNPAVEAQACDRIYRMGQQKTVHIHRLVTVGTIEQRVLNLQESKLQLAQQVLDGAASKKMNKLTLQDLKFLFDLDDKEKKKEVPEKVNKVVND